MEVAGVDYRTIIPRKGGEVLYALVSDAINATRHDTT